MTRGLEVNHLRDLLLHVLRIVFLRGSPERIPYTRKLFVIALMLALAASAAAQSLFFGDHLVFVILRVFAEVTMFMMMVVLMTARIARLRLVRTMLVLVLISLAADTLLILLSPLPWQGIAPFVAYAVGAVALYGGGNSLAWCLRSPLLHGLAYMGAYVAATVALDLGFRGLYEIVAVS